MQCSVSSGKGWQCKRNAVSGFQYCQHHRDIFKTAQQRFTKSGKRLTRRRKYLSTEEGRRKHNEACARHRKANKLSCALKTKLSQLLSGRKKSLSIANATGFRNEDDARQHFQSTFVDGMTFENYGFGAGKWNIGHRIPKCKYDHSNPENVKRCWSPTNLFAQWQDENLRLGSKLPEPKELRRLILCDVEPVEWGWAWV